jgi:hypothetical protein
VPVVCMGSGSCTVSIFSCPASATLAGQATFFSIFIRANPNLSVLIASNSESPLHHVCLESVRPYLASRNNHEYNARFYYVKHLNFCSGLQTLEYY